jgi:hypothetical protein
MPPALLISLFSFFFIVSFAYIIRRDYLSGLYYFFLFVYTIFTQIGYALYPETAIVARAYYGQEIFFDYWLFVSLSFLVIFLAFVLFWRSNRHPAAQISEDPRGSQSVGRKIVFFVTVVVFNVAMIYSFLSNYESIGYVGDIFPSKFFTYGFYSYGSVIMVLYAKLRTFSSNAFGKVLCRILLLVSLGVLVAISIRSGQRNQILALAVGIASFEFISSPSKFGKKFVKVLPLMIAALLFVIVLTNLRTQISDISPLEFIQLFPPVLGESVRAFFLSPIFQDYFAPSLQLFASIYHQLIFPTEVIRSNVLNSVVFMGYPYLQETVGKFIDPAVTRTQGYAYYLLTEGYNFAGWFGILYNAWIFWGGLLLWRKLFLRGNREFNRFMTTMMAMQVFGIVRGQSVYFIRDIYLLLLPAALLFSLATGLKPALVRHRREVSRVSLGLVR